MLFCKECGNIYPNETMFCPHCGEPNELLNKTKTKVLPGSDLRPPTIIDGGGNYGLSVKNLPIGTTLENGRYTILKKLGEGAFGVVYKASDANYNGRLKALKIIYSENYSDRLVMHKLKTEALNMIEINHPNVVRLYDIHLEGEIKFLDMEYIDGGDLVDLMLTNCDHKIQEERVLQLATQIAQGMQAIHQAGIIHQDLKPENVLLTKEDIVKITDFGISETFKSSKSRIAESEVKGTFIYASPEQLIGRNVGKEADVWSFGNTLYHILAGETLYSGVNSNDVILQIERREFEPIPDVSAKMNALLTKCLKREYKERFRDFDEVLKFIDGKETLQTKIDVPLSKLDKTIFINKDKIKESFIFVEGSTFQMGSDDGDDDEKPVHGVTLSDFYIGKYPVTQAEWLEIMGNNPSRFKNNSNPVENVSWYDAVGFCNKKSRENGFDSVYSGSEENIKCDYTKNGYRLPTEAEREYAARGGNKSKGYTYSGSDDINEVAEYVRNNDKSTKPVGGRKPNELGIYDMSGNVWEWCWDWFDSYSSGSQTDAVGPTSGSHRVYRGGSWNHNAADCRVAYRGSYYPSGCFSVIGFRLARSSK